MFKFRHMDEQKKTAMNVRPKIAGKYRIKFRAEALPLKDQVGAYRILFSHNCRFGASQVHEGVHNSTTTATNEPSVSGACYTEEVRQGKSHPSE